MRRFQDAWPRLGTLDALSWPVFWATFIAGLVGTLATSGTAGNEWQRLLTACLGQAILWLPLIAVRRVLVRKPERPRPGIVLSAFFIGAFLRALATAAVLHTFYGAQEVAPFNRVGGIFVNMLPVFIVTAVTVSLLRERRRQIQALAVTQTLIEQSFNAGEMDLEERNLRAVERVRGVLEGELAALEGAQATQTLDILQRTVTDVVRPMSHALARSLPERPAALNSARESSVPWARIVDSAASDRPFRPFLVGGYLGVMLLVLLPRRPGAALTFLLLDAILVAGLIVANLVVASATPRLSRGPRILLAGVLGVLPGVIAAASVPLLLGSTVSDLGIALGFALLATGATIGTALLAAFLRERDRLIGNLTQSTAELERALIRQRQSQWVQQKELALALHGPVQAAVTSAAIRLDGAIREGNVTPALIDQTRRELIAKLDVLHRPDGTVVSLELALERIVSTWEGVCSISVQISPTVDSLLASQPVLRSIVIDIVTEALSNAIRHGSANTASIRINVGGVHDDELQVLVVTNGFGLEPSTVRGLGTQLLDECTLAWSLVESGEGQVLEVSLPAAREFASA